MADQLRPIQDNHRQSVLRKALREETALAEQVMADARGIMATAVAIMIEAIKRRPPSSSASGEKRAE
jgi:hypothetical protein